MEQFFQNVVWQVSQMPAEQWCVFSLMVTILCYAVLKRFGTAYRL